MSKSYPYYVSSSSSSSSSYFSSFLLPSYVSSFLLLLSLLLFFLFLLIFLHYLQSLSRFKCTISRRKELEGWNWARRLNIWTSWVHQKCAFLRRVQESLPNALSMMAWMFKQVHANEFRAVIIGVISRCAALRHSGTMVQNNQESSYKFWALVRSHRSLIHLLRSLVRWFTP